MKEALWWKPLENGKVHCYLCPRDCKIGEGQAGFCFIRKNEGGKLVTLGYGRPAAVQVDPVEKKPLFHFYPGVLAFSPWVLRAATWVVSSVKTGIYPKQNRIKFDRSIFLRMMFVKMRWTMTVPASRLRTTNRVFGASM